MGILADIAKKRSPYLTLEANESIVVVYKGYKMVPSSFDPEKENFRFLLGIEIGGEMETKYWDTGSNKIALVFDTLKEGDKVKITKNVEVSKNGKDQISWSAEQVMDAEGTVTKKEADKINADMVK
jgi:hypothetical protein